MRSGRVSWEYRPYMIFPTDPGLFALLRCNGPESYFQLVDQLYAEQANWLARAEQYLSANRAAIEAMDLQTRAATLVRETGVDAFFRQRGMTQQQIDQCLADPRNLQRVADDTQHAVADRGRLRHADLLHQRHAGAAQYRPLAAARAAAADGRSGG